MFLCVRVCVCVSVSGVRSGHFVCLLLLHLFDSTAVVQEEKEEEEQDEAVAGGFRFSFVERFVATPRLRAVMCVCVCCVCSETVSN